MWNGDPGRSTIGYAPRLGEFRHSLRRGLPDRVGAASDPFRDLLAENLRRSAPKDTFILENRPTPTTFPESKASMVLPNQVASSCGIKRANPANRQGVSVDHMAGRGRKRHV